MSFNLSNVSHRLHGEFYFLARMLYDDEIIHDNMELDVLQMRIGQKQFDCVNIEKRLDDKRNKERKTRRIISLVFRTAE